MSPIKRCSAAVMAALAGLPAVAVGAEPACPAVSPSEPAVKAPARAPDEQLRVTADRVEAQRDEQVLFTGHVELSYGELKLLADELRYNRIENRLDARGHIRLHSPYGDEFGTPRLNYWLDTDTGDSDNTDFRLRRNNARGDARRLSFRGPGQVQLEDVRYSNCPPGRDDWLLRAGRLELDQEIGEGTARDVILEFLGVPIFYSPFFSFPLSLERKSGFLLPHIGQSSKLGAFVAAPYYFNLAPNYDATFTPRLMSERGLQLQGEFRYVEPSGAGQAEIEYLPNDHETDRYRAAGRLNFSRYFSREWSARTALEWVSDSNYFLDLGHTTAITSRTNLPRVAELNYDGSLWRFTARMTHQQIIDPTIAPTDRPYRQLPQLLLAGEQPVGWGGLRWRFDGEWVYFDRDTGVTGARLDIEPSLSLPLRESWGFVVPKVGLRHTAYSLNDTDDDNPSRSLAVASLDSGLVFERPLSLFGRSLRQTLEPRLYYLRIPHKDQDSLPLFDSAVPDFSFYNLFRENRFVGADRVGDANQAVAAVSTRVLDGDSGAELARLSLGQIYYFDDRQVNIPAGTSGRGNSNLVGEIYGFLAPGWYLRSGLEWDGEQGRSARTSAYLHYRPTADRVINLGYRYVQSLQEQVDLSAHWPLAGRWNGLARWVYSLPEENTLQAYGGIEYRSCCWALRAIARRAVLADGRTDKSVVLAFELTGLGSLGKVAENPLQLSRFMFE